MYSLEHAHEGFIVNTLSNNPEGLLVIAECIHDKSRRGHVLGNLYHSNANDVVSAMTLLLCYSSLLIQMGPVINTMNIYCVNHRTH